MPLTPSTQQDFLDLMARLLPDNYLAPLKGGSGPGYELLQAMAKVSARGSLAVANLDLQTFIGTAGEGSLATAMVVFSRPDATTGALTIKAGTVVTCSVSGRDFLLLADVALGVGVINTAPQLVIAFAQSYEFGNCKGPIITAAGEVIPGDIDTIKNLITSPDYADPRITAAQVADAVGGQSDDLDQLGTDLGIARQPGEVAAAYRPRLRQLVDTVSPGAIRRTLAQLFQRFAAAGYGTTYFIETWRTDYCTAYDVPNLAGLPPGSPLADPALNSCFFYDDTRKRGDPNVPNSSGFFGRYLDDSDFRGAFVIVLPNLPVIKDQGMFYDDPSPNPSGAPFDSAAVYTSVLGRRGTSAYDAPGLIGPSIQGFYDGQDLPKNAVYTGLVSVLDAIKAAGVHVAVVILP